MTTRCDVCKLIRTLSTVISTIYLTPSLMAGILRVFDVLIVHPSDGYAQIATPCSAILAIHSGYLCSSFPYQLSITKDWTYSKSFYQVKTLSRKIWFLMKSGLNFVLHLLNDLSH